MDKSSFRKHCKEKLNNAMKHKRYYHDYSVIKQVESIVESFGAKKILFYLPLKSEVNLNKLIKNYRQKKLEVFVPFIEQESFKMVKYRLPLKKDGSFKVLQSPNSNIKVRDIDIIIVPVIGVDRERKRVGFGKGMYDRFYEKLNNKPLVIFVQRTKCYTDKKVTSYHDISADFYITP